MNELAFGQLGEADLVDALRAGGAATLSLVAEDAGRVVGHVLASPVTIEMPAGSCAAIGLGPMAVLPGRQREGIGSRLVRGSLDALRQEGHQAVFLVGHPDYYPRFGFVPAIRFGVRCEFECPDEAFMALELREGTLAGRQGLLRYRPEFSAPG